MNIFSVGHSKTGTTSIFTLMKEWGVASTHQGIVANPSRSRPYDLKNPPDWARQFAKALVSFTIKKNGIRFDVSWEYSYYMRLVGEYFPESIWLVMLRDPMFVCNSLKRYAFGSMPDIDIVQLNRHYTEMHLFIIEQLQSMNSMGRKHCPFIFYMDFEKYVAGEYVKPLMKITGVEQTKRNFATAALVLSKKIRTAGDYAIVDPPKFDKHFKQADESIFDEGRAINRIIRYQIPELR